MTASGIRGIVGDNLDPALAVTVAKAFAYYLSSINETGPIIVGGDTRTSHDLYKNAITSGLNASGYDAIDIGMCPTPTGQQMIRHHNASGAIIVTASHNPAEYNGLKIMNASGSFLNPQELLVKFVDLFLVIFQLL